MMTFRNTDRPVRESVIQKSILDYLHLKGYIAFKHRNVGIYKHSTGKFIPLGAGEKGISDIIGCTRAARFFAIEVKRRGKKPTPEQVAFLERVEKSGGIAILATSIDDVQSAGL